MKTLCSMIALTTFATALAGDLRIKGHFCTCREYDEVNVLCSDSDEVDYQAFSPISAEGDFDLTIVDFNPHHSLRCHVVSNQNAAIVGEFLFEDSSSNRVGRSYQLIDAETRSLSMLGLTWKPNDDTVHVDLLKVFEEKSYF